MSTSAEYIPGVAELGRKNQAGGYAGLDENGDLIGPIINRSMLYSELLAGVVPEVGEFVYCTDTKDLHVGDGATVGGVFHSAPSIDRTLLNGGTEIKNTTGLSICDIPCKANCLYEVNAIIGITDKYTVTNNWKLVVPWGQNQSIALAGTPFHGLLGLYWASASAYWYASLFVPATRMTCAVSVGSTTTTLSALAADAVAANTASPSVIVMKAALKYTTNTTASIMLAELATQATLGVTFQNSYSSIATRRIA